MKNLSWKVAVGALTLIMAISSGYGIAVMSNGGANVSVANVQTMNVYGDEGSVEGQNIGAYTTAPTKLTDLNITNDLVVDGATTFTGASNSAGAASFTGSLRAAGFVQTGALATFTATSTATAANVCDSRHWVVTPASTTPTITMPGTSTLFADCLTTDGDVLEISVETVTTSTILAVGTGGNADLSSTLTISANKSAILRFIRNSATTYLLMVINANS
jgi:hypothetical protein